MHSPLTHAVGDKKQAYDALACDKSNLLGQLSQLCQQLYINAAHGGRGVHDNAASGAYPAIITFMEYFHKLDANAKKRIPARLMREIQTLLDLSTDSTKNVNATQNMETCIASRRGGLITEMSGHEALLSSISLSENPRSDLIRDAKAQFETAKADLNQAINENTYQGGRDALGLSVPLLEALRVEIRVRSLADLSVIQFLSPSEITELFRRDALKNETITQLGTLENFVIFAIGTPPERLKAFLTVMADRIAGAWLHNAADLSALLISLDAEKFVMVCESMKDRLSAIIKSPDNISNLLEFLPSQQRASLLEVMKDSLPGIIRTVNDFVNVQMLYLTPQQCASLVEVMKDSLPSIIMIAYDFVTLNKYYTHQQITSLLESMQDRLPAIIQEVYDFGRLEPYLTPQQHTSLLESMQDRLPALMKSVYDFRVILKYLTPQQRTSLLESTKDRLPAFIQSVKDFLSIVAYLTPQQRASLLESMGDRLPALITRYNDLFLILQYFTPEQITNQCESMRHRRLPWRYKLYHLRLSDYNSLMAQLTRLQRTALFESMRDILPDMIRSRDDFNTTVDYLSPEQCRFVYYSMQTRWLRMYFRHDHVHSAHDFYVVLRFVRIAAACSATLLKLTQYKNNESSLSPENKVNINSAIQAIKQARDSLCQQHFTFMRELIPESFASMTTALDTCCDALAATLTAHILPIKQEQKLARVQRGLFSEIVHAMEKLSNRSNSISQITTQLRRVDPIMVAKMAELKARLNETRANGTDLRPGKDDDMPTTP